MIRFKRIFIISIIVFLNTTIHCVAQRSTSEISSNPRAAYEIIKSLMQREVSNDPLETDRDTTIPLTTCMSSEAAYPVLGPLRRTLVDVAFSTLEAELILKNYKFPSQVWKDEIQKYESDYLNRVVGGYRVGNDTSFSPEGLLEVVAREINENVRSSNLNLPIVEGSAECGGGIAQFRVLISPSSAKAEIIPKLFFLFCQETGKNAEDRDICDHWLPPIRHKETVFLGGVYKYRLLKNGKSSKTSEFDSDRYTDGDTINLD